MKRVLVLSGRKRWVLVGALILISFFAFIGTRIRRDLELSVRQQQQQQQQQRSGDLTLQKAEAAAADQHQRATTDRGAVPVPVEDRVQQEAQGSHNDAGQESTLAAASTSPQPATFLQTERDALERAIRAKLPDTVQAGNGGVQLDFCRSVVLDMVKRAGESIHTDPLRYGQIPEIASFPQASDLFRQMQAFALLFPAAENITLPGASPGVDGFSCAESLMDHLFEWAIHSVGNELRNLHHKNEGIFYLSNRFLCRSRGIGGHWRFGWFPQELAQKVAAAKHSNFTMMYLSIHDADLWTIAGDNGRVRATLDKYPNAFLVHPSGRTDSDGHLYRTVPIPHAPSEIVFIDFSSIRTPYSQRNAEKVAWRGSTTGEYQKPYSATDRYRMVKAFQELNRDGKADVAFSGVAQDNHVPFSMGAQLDRSQIMGHRCTLDVDGNSNSWEGLRWKLMAGAAVVKVRSGLGFVQWYYHRLRSGEELIETDVEHVVSAAMGVVANATLGAELAAKAMAFGDKYLSPAAVDAAVWDLIGNVWRYGYDFGKDWRIQRAA